MCLVYGIDEMLWKKHGCRNVHKCKFWGDKIQVGNYVTIFKSEIIASMEGMLENRGLGQRRLKKMLEEGRGTWDYTSIIIILAKKTNIEKFKVRVRGVKHKHR